MWGRNQRVIFMTERLLESSGELVSLTSLGAFTGAAKSTLSEDLALVQEVFLERGIGYIESVPGVAGGVRFRPFLSPERCLEVVGRCSQVLAVSERIVPGGFLYMADVLSSPEYVRDLGKVLATRFAGAQAETVVTVEMRGIPLAFATASALGLPLVTVRRDLRLPEGPTLAVDYFSRDSRQVHTMSLPRRALSTGTRVLIIDDFLKGGGTISGVRHLMEEFGAQVAGTGVLVETSVPEEKMVDDHFALLRIALGSNTVQAEPAPRFLSYLEDAAMRRTML